MYFRIFIAQTSNLACQHDLPCSANPYSLKIPWKKKKEPKKLKVKCCAVIKLDCF